MVRSCMIDDDFVFIALAGLREQFVAAETRCHSCLIYLDQSPSSEAKGRAKGRPHYTNESDGY